MADVLNELVVAVDKFHVVLEASCSFGVLMHLLKVNIFLPQILSIFLVGGCLARFVMSLLSPASSSNLLS